ncbi:hexadecenal dehydrogenase [Pichia kluyveri]|uniref:Aldehyde dehydrogenase n=1 Tax=Pichia kluyveri TaxID=36015 RepID=A0AAV5RBW0_PICKL|nr:hexadecenal dehydrogenase [Pichia kluyveri]
MDTIRDKYDVVTASFVSQPRSREESKALLRKFRDNLKSSFDELSNAVREDFNKPELEFYVAEYAPAIGELTNILNNLDTILSSSKNVDSIPITFSTLSTEIEKSPLGTILIISPFNYPLILAVSPLIGAIASDQVLVVNGGIEESQFLLNDCKFDKIFFTGSTNVGKIVYKAAAEKLTPVVLELGGKSPVFISKNIDISSLEKLLKRLLWGKFTNAGQTCVAPDYLLIDSLVYDKVLNIIFKIFKSDFANVNKSDEFSHIVNERGFNRLSQILQETKGDILSGDNKSDKDSLFFSPTIVSNIDWNDSLMQSEIFGPILPIMKYNSSLTDIVKKVASIHDTPLAAYLFSSSDNDLKILQKYLRSGGIVVNDALWTAGCFITPFGGIGTSGFGNYHSKWTIDTFTHERAVLKQPLWAESLISSRYFPYTKENLKALKLVSSLPEIPIATLKNLAYLLSIFAIGFFLGKYFS